ncbi:MAG: sel1 repeat family protein [Acholeplasmatales bacterium]|nr:sel1 repeat family protein [Acholeplasmatales bacterium]
MKTLYRIFGILGIIGYIIITISALVSNTIETYIKITIIVSGLIGMIGCGVYISVASLMDDRDNYKTKVDMIESFLSEDDDYLDFKKQMAKPTSDGTIRSQKVENGILFLENKEYDYAFSEFQEAANQGHAEAYAYLGICFSLGYGTIVDYKIANDYFQKAIDAGIPDGKYLLGLSYLNGNGVEKNKEYGKTLIFEAANEGSKKAIEYISSHKY